MPKAPDFVMVGDGSGMNRCGGWALLILNTWTGGVELLTGAASRATNNLMELTPYVEGLAWLRRRGIRRATILIYSDSEWVVRCGSGEWERKANTHLWAAFDDARQGFFVYFQHISRTAFEAIEFADEISRTARLAIEAVLLEANTRLAALASTIFPQSLLDRSKDC